MWQVGLAKALVAVKGNQLLSRGSETTCKARGGRGAESDKVGLVERSAPMFSSNAFLASFIPVPRLLSSYSKPPLRDGAHLRGAVNKVHGPKVDRKQHQRRFFFRGKGRSSFSLLTRDGLTYFT